jgi:glyoxylase-like metal-dependent hydrolase (beta-lactamase superfamily II)
LNKVIPVGIGILVIVIIAIVAGFGVYENEQTPLVTSQELVTQQDLRTMIDEWMNNPEEDDTNQRLEIMKAYYTFEETGQKLTHEREGLLIMNQIRKMVSLDIPREELDQLRNDVRKELGFDTPSETKILYVDSKLVDCVGVSPQKCMIVRENPDSDWQMFYDKIEGFDYQEGIQYKLEVMITDVENPPADDSSLKYTLKKVLESLSTGIFDETLQYTSQPLTIDEKKGYEVTEIARGVYWMAGSGYQTMFVTTGKGVVVVDAPKPIGEKYLDAINEVTDEPITHMIYSHHHQDHTGAAGEIFPETITYIAHKDATNALESDNDPNRPIPNMVLEGNFNTLEIGSQTFEFHNIGDFHSKGNLLIILPQHKVGMLVDLFRPAESPYRAFGVTPDIKLYLYSLRDTLIF